VGLKNKNIKKKNFFMVGMCMFTIPKWELFMVDVPHLHGFLAG
jgi:hypothetical protein